MSTVNKLGSLFGSKTLAASNLTHHKNNRVNSESRSLEYLDALATLELTIWMAMLYDEPVNRAVRQCCKSVIARTTDWKVRAIVYGVFKSADPSMYVFNLIKDMESSLSSFEIDRQDIINISK